MGELIIYALLAVFFAVMAFYGWTTTNVFLRDESVRIYPCVVLAAIVLFLILHCIGLYKKLSEDQKKESLVAFFGLRDRNVWRLVLTVIVTAIYFQLLNLFGFVIITPFICMYYMFVLGERKWYKLLLISLAIVIPVYMIFTYGLDVRLPRGIGVFRNFSLFLEYLL